MLILSVFYITKNNLNTLKNIKGKRVINEESIFLFSCIFYSLAGKTIYK